MPKPASRISDDTEEEMSRLRQLWNSVVRKSPVLPGTRKKIEMANSVDRALRHAKPPGAFEFKEQKLVGLKAIGSIEAAMRGISEIRKLVHQLRKVVETAKTTGDKAKRAICAKEYDRLRNEIDFAATNATYEDVNLIDGGKSVLNFNLDLEHRADLTISHANLTAGRRGLDLPALRFAFAEDVEVNEITHLVDNADEHLNWATDLFKNEATMLAHRLSKSLADIQED